MAKKTSGGSERRMSDFDKEVREMFDKIDVNGDKSVSVDELLKYLIKIDVDISKKEIKDAVRKIDDNKNGKLEYSEFRKFLLKQSKLHQKVTERESEHIRATFRIFDRDNSGAIDKAELKKAMRTLLGEKSISNEELTDMMSEADLNNDGKIDYEEFVQMWWALK